MNRLLKFLKNVVLILLFIKAFPLFVLANKSERVFYYILALNLLVFFWKMLLVKKITQVMKKNKYPV